MLLRSKFNPIRLLLRNPLRADLKYRRNPTFHRGQIQNASLGGLLSIPRYRIHSPQLLRDLIRMQLAVDQRELLPRVRGGGSSLNRLLLPHYLKIQLLPGAH